MAGKFLLPDAFIRSPTAVAAINLVNVWYEIDLAAGCGARQIDLRAYMHHDCAFKRIAAHTVAEADRQVRIRLRIDGRDHFEATLGLLAAAYRGEGAFEAGGLPVKNGRERNVESFGEMLARMNRLLEKLEERVDSKETPRDGFYWPGHEPAALGASMVALGEALDRLNRGRSSSGLPLQIVTDYRDQNFLEVIGTLTAPVRVVIFGIERR